MYLYAIYLTTPLSKETLESSLNIRLKKGIEATLYNIDNDKMITLTHFNVLTFINYSTDEIIEILSKLHIKTDDSNKVYQDYPIVIDSDINSNFAIDNERIALKEYKLNYMLIISHVISQSVALEVYEKKLSLYYEKSKSLIDNSDTYSIFKRRHLAKFAKQLVLIRHEMLIDLYLLDKPNILWDDADAEDLYNKLSLFLELKDRFDVVEYKLNNIRDDIIMVMDLTNHNHSSFLEWIIIILIVIEVIMGLIEWFH